MLTHESTRLRLPRSGATMLTRLYNPPRAGEAYTHDSSTRWWLDRECRLPIDGKTVLKAHGGGRWRLCP